MNWPADKHGLLLLGIDRMTTFCAINGLPVPGVEIVSKSLWRFSVCAYYRPECGIKICLEKCQIPCGSAVTRNWTWPASSTDREPYGVIAHELGHHVDWLTSEKKGAYFGDYSVGLRAASKEKPLTSYCDNDAEWFAEIFRLFVTNPDLLRVLRPITFGLLCQRWKHVEEPWLQALGDNVPERVTKALQNKIAPIRNVKK